MNATSNIQTLPLDIGYRICTYLDGSHVPSLINFSAVNKHFRDMALPLVFRDISITMWPDGASKLAVQEAVDILSSASSFRHVRRLDIRYDGRERSRTQGQTPSPDPEENVPEVEKPKRMKRSDYDEDDMLIDDDFGYVMTVYETMEVVNQRNYMWLPMARLLEKLHGLCDLVYECYQYFPPCLLKTLQTHLPNCRLHIMHYHFASRSHEELDPHELAVATAPQLHRIHALCSTFDSSGAQNYNKQSAMRILAGLAPNLKEMRILIGRPLDSIRVRKARRRGPRDPWKGFGADDSQEGTKKGRVQKLSLEQWNFTLDAGKDFNQRTNFSYLKTLKVGHKITRDALIWLATECKLTELTSLTLNYIVYEPNYSYEHDKKHLLDAVSLFIQSLPSLTSMSLDCEHNQVVFDSIMERHGATLRKLSLGSSVVFKELSTATKALAQIRYCCPILENLAVILPRSQLCAEDMAVYKVIGSIPRLQAVRVQLQFGDPADGWEVMDPSRFHGRHLEPEHEVTWKKLRDDIKITSIVNRAIDQKLAESILRAICSAKTPGMLSLESLQLSMNTGPLLTSSGSDSEFSYIVEQVSRSWFMTRGIRDDSRNMWYINKRERDESGDLYQQDPLSRVHYKEWWKGWYGWPLLE